MKTCTRCGMSKPEAEFNRQASQKSGLQPHCRACQSVMAREYRQSHAEQIKASKQAYHAANSDRIIAKVKAWVEAHPGYEKERSARRRMEHSEQVKKWSRDWAANHPEQRIAWRENNKERYLEQNQQHQAKRRASKLAAPGNGITRSEWNALKDEYCYRCAYCGERTKLELDHIVPLSHGGPHDVSNAVPACRSCNAHKADTSLLVYMYRKVSYA